MLNFIDSFKRRVKNWWISLLVGVLAIFLAVYCLLSPDVTLVSMTYVFMIVFFLGGIFDIIFAISNRGYMQGWGWSLTAGIFEVLMGILLFLLPLPIVTGILIYLVGFWILFRSLWGIGESCSLQMLGFKGWGWLLALSILSLLFSFFYLLSPLFGGIFVVALISVAMMFYGVFRITLAFELRRINKKIKELKK